MKLRAVVFHPFSARLDALALMRERARGAGRGRDQARLEVWLDARLGVWLGVWLDVRRMLAGRGASAAVVVATAERMRPCRRRTHLRTEAPQLHVHGDHEAE